jgi:hypothetical protein
MSTATDPTFIGMEIAEVGVVLGVIDPRRSPAHAAGNHIRH